jgi:hypothetical protein
LKHNSFSSKTHGKSFEDVKNTASFTYFTSIQDLRGSAEKVVMKMFMIGVFPKRILKFLVWSGT